MIRPDDRLTLPSGVVVTAAGLYDAVRGATVPINETGRIVLARATPAVAADDVARRFAVDRERALSDVLGFCCELNDRMLLNVTPRRRALDWTARWLAALPALLPQGLVPRLPAARRHVDTSSVSRLALSAPSAVAPAAFAYAVGASAVALLALAPSGGLPLAAAAGAAVGTSVAVHELGHLAALISIPACVAVRGFRIAVVHRSVATRRARIVAATGPTAGVALAAFATAATRASPGPELATAASVLATQCLGFTVATRDGRRLCGLR